MIANAIRNKLEREPFEPFQLRSSSGEAYIVASPDLIVLLNAEVFVAAPDRDRSATLPYLYIAAVESLSSGPRKGRRRRR